MPELAPLTDGFGRRFEYLRVSVDDACNFSCSYCLPDGWRKTQQEPALSLDEVRRLAAAFAELGVWKFRLTGGEPTLRRDIVELCAAAASAPGCRRLALSTNGYRLAELARPLRRAGLSAVNVSVDTLDASSFARVCGRDLLAQVLRGVDEALEAGLEVKINAVLLASVSQEERDALVAWTRVAPISVRFIELMPTARNEAAAAGERVHASSVVERLRAEGWKERPREPGDGPARRFANDGHAGTVGVIAPYAADFCASCNRLRVTSRGALRLCLFAEGGDASLRPWLERDDQRAELQARVRALLAGKAAGHRLAEGLRGDVATFAAMGG